MDKKGFSLFSLMEGQSTPAVQLDSRTEKQTSSFLDNPSKILKREIEFPSRRLRGEPPLKEQIKLADDAAVKYGVLLEDINSGTTYLSDRRVSVIGTAPGCDILITGEAAHGISRKHAQIEEDEGTFYITDLSTNGTYIAERVYEETKEKVNVVRFPKDQAMEIKDGEMIRFAQRWFKFSSVTNGGQNP